MFGISEAIHKSKNNLKYKLFFCGIIFAAVFSCDNRKQTSEDIVKSNYDFASEQLAFATTEINKSILEVSPDDRKRREERNA